jgi:hypothetical protein
VGEKDGTVCAATVEFETEAIRLVFDGVGVEGTVAVEFLSITLFCTLGCDGVLGGTIADECAVVVFTALRAS